MGEPKKISMQISENMSQVSIAFDDSMSLFSQNSPVGGGAEKNRQPPFVEEHLKLMRALYDSLERENHLQREFRRMKEEMFSVALKYSVAVRTSEEDDKMLTLLRREAQESKFNELKAQKQLNEASEMISALNLEVSALKRKLKAYEGLRRPQMSTAAGQDLDDSSQSGQNHEYTMNTAKVLADADAEVERMLRAPNTAIYKSPAKNANPSDPTLPSERITNFQEWKVKNFFYTPDTPMASQDHDEHMVDVINFAASSLRENMKSIAEGDITQPWLSRNTVGNLGKAKQPMQILSPVRQSAQLQKGPKMWETNQNSPSKHNISHSTSTASIGRIDGESGKLSGNGMTGDRNVMAGRAAAGARFGHESTEGGKAMEKEKTKIGMAGSAGSAIRKKSLRYNPAVKVVGENRLSSSSNDVHMLNDKDEKIGKPKIHVSETLGGGMDSELSSPSFYSP
jgi:hypothetical protein